MGYFSNGAEGEMYQEDYCLRCVHYGDENKGCPIWGIHLFNNYDGVKDKKIGSILNQLIPRSKDGLSNKRCELFYIKDTALYGGRL